MANGTFTEYTKTTIVKASYATSALAQASTAMKKLSTKVLSFPSVTVFLNCDAGGTAALDVDIQVTPDDTSEVWYTIDQFSQVIDAASTQAKSIMTVGRQLRTLPTLTGTHNFGCYAAFPMRGYAASS